MNAGDRDVRVETEIAAPLREARPALDDVGRARLTSSIDAALEREDLARETRRSGTTHGWWTRRRWGIVAAGAAAAIALFIAFRPHGRRAQAPLPPPDGTVAIAPTVNPPPALLRPYQQPGGAPAEASAPTTSLVALRGERARATITNVVSSHVSMVSHPQVAIDAILAAVAAVAVAA